MLALDQSCTGWVTKKHKSPRLTSEASIGECKILSWLRLQSRRTASCVAQAQGHKAHRHRQAAISKQCHVMAINHRSEDRIAHRTQPETTKAAPLPLRIPGAPSALVSTGRPWCRMGGSVRGRQVL